MKPLYIKEINNKNKQINYKTQNENQTYFTRRTNRSECNNRSTSGQSNLQQAQVF